MKCEHDLKVIYRANVGYDVEEVVRWCRKCGAIVVDGDCDNRTNPGAVMKMELPLCHKEACRHDNQNIGWVCCDCGKVVRPKATDLDLAHCGYLPATLEQIEKLYDMSVEEEKETVVEIGG